jgi:hypothetical protein
MNHPQNAPVTAKRDWVRPAVKRLEAGAAESQRGAAADGGGGNQGS